VEGHLQPDHVHILILIPPKSPFHYLVKL
jgi:REP element-mobilizing transposase RayT